MSLRRFFEKFLLSLKRESFTSVGQESGKLKTIFIAKAIAVTMACSILALFLVPTGFAYKLDFGGGNPATATSCNHKPGAFTIFPYSKLKTSSDGSVSGIE